MSAVARVVTPTAASSDKGLQADGLEGRDGRGGDGGRREGRAEACDGGPGLAVERGCDDEQALGGVEALVEHGSGEQGLAGELRGHASAEGRSSGGGIDKEVGMPREPVRHHLAHRARRQGLTHNPQLVFG